MTTLTMNREILVSRDRFRRTMTVSLGVHALLLAWLVLQQSIAPATEGIIEVTWLEPAPVAPAAPPPAAAAPTPAPEAALPAAPQPQPAQKFLRRETAAPAKPSPQVDTASRDLVKQRLEQLRSSSAERALPTAAPSSNLLAAAAAPAPSVPKGTGAELRRVDAPAARSVPLVRGATAPPRAATTLAVATAEAALAPVAAPDLDKAARRSLAGADLVGEVADRPIVFHVMPVYPEWAKEQAIEGTVTLRFFVLPDGRVKENIQVDRTAGFAAFDANAVAALAQWRFAPLTGNAAEQWGSITFRYRLRG